MSRVTKIEPISIVALPIQKTSIKKVAAYARLILNVTKERPKSVICFLLEK